MRLWHHRFVATESARVRRDEPVVNPSPLVGDIGVADLGVVPVCDLGFPGRIWRCGEGHSRADVQHAVAQCRGHGLDGDLQLGDQLLKVIETSLDSDIHVRDLAAGRTIRTIRCRRLTGGEFQPTVPILEGIKIDDRWVVIYSKYDIGCALEKHPSTDCLGHDHPSALKYFADNKIDVKTTQ